MSLEKFHISKLGLLQFGFLLLTSITVYSQDIYDRKISVSEWIYEMVECTEDEYWLKNAKIIWDEDNKSDNFYNYRVDNRDELDSILETRALKVKCQVILFNCDFSKSIGKRISHIEFQNKVSFQKCRGPLGRIEDCIFRKGFEVHDSKISTLQLRNNKFYSKVKFYNSELIRFLIYGSTFHSTFSFKSCASDQFILYKSKFDFVEPSEEIPRAEFSSLLLVKDMEIHSCEFTSTGQPAVVDIRLQTSKLFLDGNTFNNVILDLSAANAEQALYVSDNKFEYLGLDGTNYSLINSTIEWDQIRNFKIGYWYPRDYSKEPYLAKSDSELAAKPQFDEMMRIYNKLFQMYKQSGNRESANSCYIEMKDIETRRLNYLYRQNPSTGRLFDWRLNQFLKLFCDYGTNPVKSLIISMWIILGFACIYFFTYSNWDKINRSFLVSRYRK
ncbi:MAG: hypothetical protein COB85_00780, partial [Bacteroidetes bacterium]